MQKHAQVCKSMHKYAKEHIGMQVCKSLQKKATFSHLFPNLHQFLENFIQLFGPFFQILCQFFPANFRHFKTTFCLCFCFVCHAVQIAQYKMQLPFLGGGGVKAIPRTALLLSKIH
jgi:hypothetical protein